jgi:Protein of unknown function (DUF1573)
MRKTLSIVVLLISALFAGAQAQSEKVADGTQQAQSAEVLKLKETEHDFGKIPQGRPVYYTFEIVNTGTVPLKLDDVHPSCGCTTPEWSREPIAPGATAQIKVGYNAAAENYFEKFISITYNTNQTKQLKIFGTVWKAPEGAAPANASVQFLKKQTL